MKTSKPKRTQERPYLPNESPEDRAAAKAAFDRHIEQMWRPLVQYRAMMEQARAMQQAGDAQHAKKIKPL